MRALGLAFALAWIVALQPALAQEEAPDVLMKRISEEVIAELRRDQDIRAGNGAKIAAFVDAKIVPHFDFRRVTRIAMRRTGARRAPSRRSG